MSLNALVSTVATEFKISENEALIKIVLFYEIVGGNDFTARTLLSREYDASMLDALLGFMKELCLVEITGYEYDCPSTEIHGEVDSLKETCIGCSQPINDLRSNHSLTPFLCMKPEIINQINERKIDILKTCLIEGGYELYKLLHQNRRRIVPLLGAGVSISWGIPNWAGLLSQLKSDVHGENNQVRYSDLISRGDYLNALSLLVRNSYTIMNDDQLRTRIADIIGESSYNTPVLHNYEDILKIKSDFILTTNYDTTLSKYARDRLESPLCLSDIENVQRLTSGQQRRVIHIHGIADRPRTMIVSQQGYEAVYHNQQEFKAKMIAIMGNKSLVFIGFSFQDEYFKQLYFDVTSELGGDHFLITANPVLFDIQQAAEIRLRIVGLRVNKNADGSLDNDSYTLALSQILSSLT